MDAILTQVKHLASTADEVSRAKLLLALRDAQFTLETPWDTMMRLVGLVRLPHRSSSPSTLHLVNTTPREPG